MSGIATIAEQLQIDARRVRPVPWPAREADLLALDGQGILCEVIDGYLVEKPMGTREALLASWILTLLNLHVRPRNLGLVVGPDGIVRMNTQNYFLPDVSFWAWDALPEGVVPEANIWPPPTLAIEVLSDSNTQAEMENKRETYFAWGVRQVWEVDRWTRTITVYTATTQATEYDSTRTIDADAVIPGFTLTVGEVFSSLDQRRPAGSE